MTSEAPEDAEIFPPAAPPPTTAARIVGAISSLVGGAAWLALLVILVTIVPRFEEIFQKFDIKGGLPESTQVMISVSHIFRSYWFFLLPLVGGATVAMFIPCISGRKRSVATISVVFGAVSCLLFAIAVTVIVVGLFMPLISLVQGVSGAKHGGPGPGPGPD